MQALPCFEDNYIWLISDGALRWVVDPGDAGPVLTALAAGGPPLRGILVTHRHADHTAGIPALLREHPVPVFGPAEAGAVVSELLRGGERLTLPGLGRVDVLAVGAHTHGHIAYHLPDAGLLLCGDSLFSAGCGRLFDGTGADLAAVMSRYDALPADTVLYPTHEYTEANLRFAAAVEPDNEDIRAHQHRVAAWRAKNRPSLPTTLALERLINPYLRAGQPSVVTAVRHHAAADLSSRADILAALRAWKDSFKG